MAQAQTPTRVTPSYIIMVPNGRESLSATELETRIGIKTMLIDGAQRNRPESRNRNMEHHRNAPETQKSLKPKI